MMTLTPRMIRMANTISAASMLPVSYQLLLQDRLLLARHAGRLRRSDRSRKDDARAHHHARRRVLNFQGDNQVSNQQPAYRAFTVIKREGQDDYWLPIGAAFPHQS